MIKDNIALYDDSKVNLSLRTLPLVPDCEGRIEYIFYTLNVARDFDDLSSLLGRVLDCPFTELCREDHFILYEVMLEDKPYSLKFRIKKRRTEVMAS